MKMNRAKKGAVVLNKLYGDFYIVDSNSKDENGEDRFRPGTAYQGR